MTAPPAVGAGPAATLLRAESLATGVALSAVAGFLDAFAYLEHGVFASFVTGNMVLLGIGAAAGRSLGLYALPILAYVAGTALAQLRMRDAARRALRGHSPALALAVEVAMLVALAQFSQHLDDHLLVPLLTFTAAIQNTTFRTLGTRTYNSAFMTGNLQVLTSALATGSLPPVAAKLADARDLGAVILGFTGGGFAGALLAPRVHAGALLAPAGLLAALGLALLIPSLTVSRAR